MNVTNAAMVRSFVGLPTGSSSEQKIPKKIHAIFSRTLSGDTAVSFVFWPISEQKPLSAYLAQPNAIRNLPSKQLLLLVDSGGIALLNQMIENFLDSIDNQKESLSLFLSESIANRNFAIAYALLPFAKKNDPERVLEHPIPSLGDFFAEMAESFKKGQISKAEKFLAFIKLAIKEKLPVPRIEESWQEIEKMLQIFAEEDLPALERTIHFIAVHQLESINVIRTVTGSLRKMLLENHSGALAPQKLVAFIRRTKLLTENELSQEMGNIILHFQKPNNRWQFGDTIPQKISIFAQTNQIKLPQY